MKSTIVLKSTVASFLYQTGGIKWKLSRIARRGHLILAYHRILPPSMANWGVQAGMYVTPEVFDKHLKFLQNCFEITPIERLALEREDVDGTKSKKPRCVLTFDDGWKDFYDFAFPLLKRYQAPATVFLPTKFIDSNRIFWTDRFAHILRYRRASLDVTLEDTFLSEVVQEIQRLQGTFEDQLEAGIELLKKYPLDTIDRILQLLAKIWCTELKENGRDFLNWDEINEMLDSGLISFGSHTANHQILSTLDECNIQRELIISKKMLLTRGVVDPSFIPFCYPNGDYTKEIARMVQTAGYHLAVTTRKGWNKFDADMFDLKRVCIHQDMSLTVPMFACRIAGLL